MADVAKSCLSRRFRKKPVGQVFNLRNCSEKGRLKTCPTTKCDVRRNLLSACGGSLMLILGLTLNAVGADEFREKVLPFVKTYCVECHDSKKMEAQLDLTKYSSAEMVAADFRQWEHVVTFVTKEEMPPPDAKQPTPAERAVVLKVLDQLVLAEARKTAGDPGVVLPRRLSNAEYNNAIRDLTGVDIRPADSFPVDPASGEGFSNTGEALVMSPNLFKKYYAAAQQVADHVLLTPTRMEFAPHPVVAFADQKKLTEQAILKFYADHTVDYPSYLAAAWSFQHRPSALKDSTLGDWATQRKLSPKYLQALWDLLHTQDAQGGSLTQWLSKRWTALPAPQVAGQIDNPPQNEIRALAQDIQRLSKLLCQPETEAIVSNAGNGPVQHIDRRKKTAASRDAFNPAVITDNRRIHAEISKVDGKTSRIVIRTDASDASLVVLKNVTLSTSNPQSYKLNDPQKNVSLKTVLAEHAPDEMKRLNLGVHPLGQAIDADSLVVKAPSILSIELPTQAFGDARSKHFFAEASLDRQNSKSGLVGIVAAATEPQGDWQAAALPLINPDHPIAKDFATSGTAFCKLFPNRFYFADDTRGLSAGFHLIEGFFRDDQPLCKLVLSEPENQELDRLWDELSFVTGVTEKMLRGFVFFERSERNFMKHPDFDSIKEEDPELTSDATLRRFEQIYLARSGVKGSDAEIQASPVHHFFEDIRQSINRRAAQWPAAAPIYLRRLQEFARMAFRRPLSSDEQAKLTAFFQEAARPESLGIEQAVRASIVRILVSPHFCYLADSVPEGDTIKPLPDLALASRLSFFLWSSIPDAELMAVAEAGKLNNPEAIRSQTRRMLRDPKVSGFAVNFYGQWLNYRDFRQTEAVNRTAFPAFDDSLKQAMFEEPTRLVSHILQNDLPITDLLQSDATFVNKRLAQHYGLPFSQGAGDWQLTTGLKQQGRGGLLGMAVFLTKNSQPQRTSPVKRGFWVVHKLLGEHIPPPPPNVAVLPAKETDTDGKTIRQLLALHTEDSKCARCHLRFDPIGLAMEGFDSIGRARSKDLAGRAIDNAVQLPTGEQARGVAEFSEYLAKHRRKDFTKTLARKLLGYATGRSLQLSDQVLLEEMEAALVANQDRATPLFEAITTSDVFRQQRCRSFDASNYSATVTKR